MSDTKKSSKAKAKGGNLDGFLKKTMAAVAAASAASTASNGNPPPATPTIANSPPSPTPQAPPSKEETIAAAQAAKAKEQEDFRKELGRLTSGKMQKLMLRHGELATLCRTFVRVRNSIVDMYEKRCEQDPKDKTIFRYVGKTQRSKKKKTAGAEGEMDESVISEDVLKNDIQAVFKDILSVTDELRAIGITSLDVCKFYATHGLHQEWDVVLFGDRNPHLFPLLDFLKDVSKMEEYRQIMEVHCRNLRQGSSVPSLTGLDFKPNDKASYDQGGFNRGTRALAFDMASKSSLEFIYPIACKWLEEDTQAPSMKDVAILSALFIFSYILFNRWEVIGQGNVPEARESEISREIIAPNKFASYFKLKESTQELVHPIDTKDLPMLLVPGCFHPELYPIVNISEYQHNRKALQMGVVLPMDLRDEEEDGYEEMDDAGSDGEEDRASDYSEEDDDDSNSGEDEEDEDSGSETTSKKSKSKKRKAKDEDGEDEDEEEEEGDKPPSKKKQKKDKFEAAEDDPLDNLDEQIEKEAKKAAEKAKAKAARKAEKKAAKKAAKKAEKKKAKAANGHGEDKSSSGGSSSASSDKSGDSEDEGEQGTASGEDNE